MRLVEIRVSTRALADALTAMRMWLDHHNCVPLRFDTRSDARRHVVVSVEFAADDIAVAFRRTFDIRRSG